MTPQDPQSDTITIRCPSCGSKFDVDEQMRGRPVECGECGHHFTIADPVITRGRRFYPGEKRDPLLNQVAKIQQPLPNADDKGVPESFASHTTPDYMQPVSPQRFLLGVLSVFAVIVTALFLILGAKRGGALDGVSIENRILMASFVALLATGLLIYSNAKAWLLMLVVGLLLGSGLVLLPVYFGGGAEKQQQSDAGRAASLAETRSDSNDRTYTIDELREFIGTDPLEKERKRLLEAGSETTALGLWLTNLEEHNKLLIKDYMIRETQAASQTHFYPRGRRNFLMVVTGIPDDLKRLEMAAVPLGKVKAVHDQLHLIEVEVNNANFKSGSIEILTDPKHQKFYELNSIELKSVDLDRVSAAVRRLSEAEPILLRDDIHTRLVDLLASNWYEDKGGVCRALLVWAKDDGEAGKIALAQAGKLHKEGKDVAEEMVALCLQQKEMGILSLLHELWQNDPTRWEPWFREGGRDSEQVILGGFDKTTGTLRQSACRILGQVGGEDSLPILRATVESATDTETRISASSSILLIVKRLEISR